MAQSISANMARTSRAQADAADPRACVWVSANAGTGKTHVLTMRVLRLMLGGTAPSRILCLTYTKAAAAEMSKRVFDELASWVMLAPPDLAAALQKLTGQKPSPAEIALARTLFTAAIETPGGLKVQTIHAFCERLLQRFPLEAGVTPGFAILEDEMARKLKREAIDVMLTRATARDAGGGNRTATAAMSDALKTAIAYAADDRFDEILGEALRHRAWLDAAVRLPADTAKGASGLEAVQALFNAHFGVRAKATPEAIANELAKLLPDATLKRVRDVLAGGLKTDVGLAEKLDEALTATTPIERAGAVHGFLTKSDGTAREKFFTKDLARDHADLDEALRRVQDRALALCNELRAAEAITATMALHRLADAVMQNYQTAKARRAGLDFDDLIAHTTRLLASGTSPEWVLYKLDNGLDHILVDESQDTSPDQWKVVEALAKEFFSGRGAGDTVRTIFAVGDEKQSIYSFQGAAPEMFSDMGAGFETMAGKAGVLWRQIPLNVSFRSVAPVLGAVDLVFANPDATPGLASSAGLIEHIAKRQGSAGLVELWPAETYDAPPETDAWSPLDETAASAPAVRLAAKIAAQIKTWLTTGERLPSENRAIGAGDILILVRKRNPFAGPMVAALKAAGIAVAGADRIRLSEQIAVEDLLSLGDLLTLPEDDLALAEVLKSPLFGLNDDDLLRLAWQRKGTLWQSLLKQAGAVPRFAPAAGLLKKWRKAADFIPPFEFFAGVLDGDGMRKKLVARLGPDAADPIDEFLNLALTYDDGAPPSLSRFLAWVREGNREIKRDMEHGRNEVRVMTVHGAKGLEAPIVFLPDTCSAGSASRQGGKPLLLDDMVRPQGAPPPFFWPVKGTSKLDAVAAAKDALEASDAEERDRLLYVAMTRARDRLYIAGFEGKNGRARGCWYDLIAAALAPVLKTCNGTDGASVLRLESPQDADPETPKAALAVLQSAMPPPSWANRPAPREPQLAVPLAPSRLAPYESDEAGEPLSVEPPQDRFSEPPGVPPMQSAVPPVQDGVPPIQSRVPPIQVGASASKGSKTAAGYDGARFLRGTLTHALLQHLPTLEAARWARAAEAFVAARGSALSNKARKSICSETLAILTDPRFAALFGPMSQAEVPIVAEIPRPPGHAGPPLRLTGQIDRLAVTERCVLIVDYKTNRQAPQAVADVAEVYLYQLAAYRLALSLIFKDKIIKAVLLWTDGAKILEIPQDVLDRYAKLLWQLDPSRLDA